MYWANAERWNESVHMCPKHMWTTYFETSYNLQDFSSLCFLIACHSAGDAAGCTAPAPLTRFSGRRGCSAAPRMRPEIHLFANGFFHSTLNILTAIFIFRDDKLWFGQTLPLHLSGYSLNKNRLKAKAFWWSSSNMIQAYYRAIK